LSGDSKLLDELAEVFLAEYPPLLAQIRESIDRGDASGLKLAAHTLKGALVNFAAAPAASAAAALELMGCAGDLSGAADVCQQLECHLERLTPILSARAAAGRA
jgi:HPt (histidine-containing phosphotransfer) domain-containing protein